MPLLPLTGISGGSFDLQFDVANGTVYIFTSPRSKADQATDPHSNPITLKVCRIRAFWTEQCQIIFRLGLCIVVLVARIVLARQIWE